MRKAQVSDDIELSGNDSWELMSGNNNHNHIDHLNKEKIKFHHNHKKWLS